LALRTLDPDVATEINQKDAEEEQAPSAATEHGRCDQSLVRVAFVAWYKKLFVVVSIAVRDRRTGGPKVR
jgi:hypothetical protein